MSTRPGEIARIKGLAGGDERWEEALTALAVLTERSEQSLNWQRGTDEWRAMHDRQDAESFVQLRADVQTLKSSIGGVSSSVEAEKNSNRYTLREMVVGFMVLCGALGGLITFIVWTIGNSGKGAP